MDPMIDAYIQTTYSPELGVDIYSAFTLFDNFDVQDYQQEFIDLLMTNAEYDSGTVQDIFLGKVLKWTDFVFTHHLIEVVEDTKLHARVQIMQALYQVQDLDDYTSLAVCLESDMDTIEKFAYIVSELSDLSSDDVLLCMEHVDPIMLDRLYGFINMKSAQADERDSYLEEQKIKIVQNLKKFTLFLKGEDSLGMLMLKSGALPGQAFKQYFPYMKDVLLERAKTEAPRTVAVDVLSVLYLSSDGMAKPFETYRENSLALLEDSKLVMSVDVALFNLVGEYTGFLGAMKNEETRLS